MMQSGITERLRSIPAAWVCIIILFAGAVAAEDRPQSQSQKIFITADKLVGNSRNGFAEFIGNVEAVQEDFSIRADSIQIYFRQAGGNVAATEDAIEKIVAIGNVRIRSQDRQAETERAEYTLQDGNLLLTGANSTVTDGKNLIKGARIRLNRIDGRISVEGDDANRVRAVFYPSEKPSLSKEPKSSKPSKE